MSPARGRRWTAEGRPLPIDVTYLADAGVVEMLFPEAYEHDELYQAVSACMTLAEQHECHRFLVDTRLTGQKGDTFDILKLAEFMASLPPGAIEREAILPPAAGPPADDFRFFETAARNRGLNVRIYDTREDSLAWLVA